jgi:predicted nucleic acid-binding protein
VVNVHRDARHVGCHRLARFGRGRCPAGPHLTREPREAARRQARLQEAESKLEPIHFDAAAVRSYGLVVAAVTAEGRAPLSRFADLLVAASALANGLDLDTRNGADFRGIDQLLTVIEI